MKEDQGRLLALVSILIADSKLRGAQTSDIVQAIQEFSASPPAVREAAMGYVPTMFAKLNFPRDYWNLLKAKENLNSSSLSVEDEKFWTNMLIRSAARLEFGVPVNSKWYGTLIMLTKWNAVPQKKIRQLLGASTVFWTKDGELLVEQHHWITKILIAVFGLLVILYGIATPLCLISEASLPIWKCVAYGVGFFSLSCLPLLYVTWYMGPFSWQAAVKLQSFPDIQKSFNT